MDNNRIDFTLLTQQYGKAGAREKFEELCVRVLKAKYPEIKAITPKPGDKGIDFF